MNKDLPVILYEDTCCLVVNKPAGLLTNLKSDQAREWTLEEWLKQRGPVFLVHRLDKGTSGCLLIAKDADTAHLFEQAFQDRTIHKHYVAGVYPGVLPARGQITIPLPGRQGFKVPAQTDYHVRHRGPAFDLVDVDLKTGRKNQIRLHFKLIGAPLAGDDVFGQFKWNKELRKQFGLKRLLLHAATLDFTSPVAGPQHVSAPLPPDFQEV